MTTTRRLLLLGLFLFSLYLVYLVLQPLLGGILWAAVLVTAFHPIYVRLVRLMRGREWPAAILLSTAVAAAIAVPISLAIVRLARSLGDAYTFFADRAGVGSADPLQPLIAFLEGVKTFASRYVDVSQFDARDAVLDMLRKVAETLSSKSGVVIGNTVTGLITFFVMFATMTFLFKDSARLLAIVRQSLPLSEADRERIFSELRSVVHGVFYGFIMTAAAQGIVAGVAYAVAGLPAPFTLGAATFICGLLPIGGAFLVWFPAGVYLIFTQKVVAGVFVLAWGAGVVSLMDNFLRPFFIRGRTRMHLLLISFGTFGGIAAFGVVGLFVGPMVIALFLGLLEVMRGELMGEATARRASVE